MKKNWINILAIIIILIIENLVIYRMGVRKAKIDIHPVQGRTDTVYMSKPFQVSKSLKHLELPKYLLLYPPASEPEVITQVIMKHDTVEFQLNTGNSLSVNSNFLTQYPDTERLIQLSFDNKRLDLTTQDTSGKVSTKGYELDLQKYRYLYHSKEMTKDKVRLINLRPVLYTTYRPFNQMLDLNLGLAHQSKKLSYEVGVNAFYYPKFQNHLGKDLYLKLQYTL